MARFVAYADVFDSLTSVRPYKKAWPVGEAVAFIEAQGGAHFEPALMGAFHRALPEMLAVMERFAEHMGEMADGDLV